MPLHRCYDLIAHDIHTDIPTFTVLDEFLDDKWFVAKIHGPSS